MYVIDDGVAGSYTEHSVQTTVSVGVWSLSYMVHSIVTSYSGYILNTDFARTQEQQEDNSGVAELANGTTDKEKCGLLTDCMK